MKLAPVYINFMVEMVGISLSKAVFIPLSTMEQATLLSIALHMALSEEDRIEIMVRLKDYGNLVHDFWDEYVKAVRGHNASGRSQAIMNVNDVMERMRNDPTTQRSVGL